MSLNLQYGKDDANRSRRTSFDSDAANYDRVRPRYCPELFEAIISAAEVKGSAQALEVGPGTGQATAPFVKMGCRVTAAELGESLAEYLAEKYADCPNLSVWQGDFLNFPEDERFDLLYSATAFHWIPREEGFQKTLRLLKPGGTLALFWNHPIVGDKPGTAGHDVVQEVYSRFGKGGGGKIFDGSSCAAYEDALRAAGFEAVESRLFTAYRCLTGREYVALMRSYSDHMAMPEDKRAALEEAMEEAIRTRLEDRLVIRDVMDLYLAKSPEK